MALLTGRLLGQHKHTQINNSGHFQEQWKLIILLDRMDFLLNLITTVGDNCLDTCCFKIKSQLKNCSDFPCRKLVCDSQTCTLFLVMSAYIYRTPTRKMLKMKE